MTPDIDELVRAAQRVLVFPTAYNSQEEQDAAVALDKALAPFTKPKLVYVLPEWEEFVKDKCVSYVNGGREYAELTHDTHIKRGTYNALREATAVKDNVVETNKVMAV